MAFYVVQFLTGLASAASLFLVASGLSIIFGVTRIVNFAHGAFYMLGAYVAFTLTERFSGAIGFWGGIVAAGLIVAAAGVIIEMVLLRRIYHAPELFQLLATFGLTLMVEDLVVLIWGPSDLLGSIIGAFVAAVLVSELNAFGILIFPKISIILVFLVMAAVLIVRPWGLFGKAEAPARRTPGLTVNPWRPLTSNERLAAVAALALAAVLPLVGGNYALTVGSEIAIFVIFAASLHFLMSVGGLASFGHAAYFGLGAYGVAFLAKMAGLPMIACLLLGPLLGLVGAGLFGFFAVQLSGVYFAMLTLAFAQIVWSIAFQWVEVTGGDNGILGVWPEKWAAGPASFYWLSIGIAALAVAALRIIVFSPFGYALRATRASLPRSEAIGIDGKRIQWTAFVIAGTIAGVAGALFAYLKGSVFPDSLGISLSVDALVMVLLGGVETISGAVVGAIVYKALNIWLVSQTDLSKLMLGAFVVLIVVAFPKGIVGMLTTIHHRRRSASAKSALLASPIETAE